jgi:hypothetical protein
MTPIFLNARLSNGMPHPLLQVLHIHAHSTVWFSERASEACMPVRASTYAWYHHLQTVNHAVKYSITIAPGSCIWLGLHFDVGWQGMSAGCYKHLQWLRPFASGLPTLWELPAPLQVWQHQTGRYPGDWLESFTCTCCSHSSAAQHMLRTISCCAAAAAVYWQQHLQAALLL